MKNILDSATSLSRSANQVESSLSKRADHTKTVQEGGSSPGDPLTGNGSWREVTCDVNVGVKRSYTIWDEGRSLDETVNSDGRCLRMSCSSQRIRFPRCQECRCERGPTAETGETRTLHIHDEKEGRVKKKTSKTILQTKDHLRKTGAR